MRKETEQKAVALLQKHPCFAAAAQEELARLVRHESAVLREFAKGQTVFPSHGGPRAFGLLLSGGCLVKRGEKIVGTVPGGSAFGLESLFGATRGPTENYMAQTDGKALLIPRTAVEELMQENFAVAQNYLAFLTARTEDLNSSLAAAGSGGAEAKTAAFLLEHKKKDSDEIALPPDFDKLAHRIGINRDAFSRALDRLTAAGAIGLCGSRLTIKSREKLNQFIIENEE